MSRRGRPRKYIRYWKCWGAVAFLLIGMLCYMIGYGIAQAFHLTLIESRVNEQLATVKMTENAQLRHRNSALADANTALNTKLQEQQEGIGRHVSPEARQYVASLIQKYFGQDAQSALAVSKCESGWNPFNYSIKPNNDGSSDHGTFQVNDRWHKVRFEKMFGVPFEIGVYMPELNIQYAKYLFDHSGWNPWVCGKIIGV